MSALVFDALERDVADVVAVGEHRRYVRRLYRPRNLAAMRERPQTLGRQRFSQGADRPLACQSADEVADALQQLLTEGMYLTVEFFVHVSPE